MNILRRTACETGDTVRSRVRVHKEQIAHKEFRMMGMSKHFSIYGRNKTPNFFIIPSSLSTPSSKDLRKIMEEKFSRSTSQN